MKQEHFFIESVGFVIKELFYNLPFRINSRGLFCWIIIISPLSKFCNFSNAVLTLIRVFFAKNTNENNKHLLTIAVCVNWGVNQDNETIKASWRIAMLWFIWLCDSVGCIEKMSVAILLDAEENNLHIFHIEASDLNVASL